MTIVKSQKPRNGEPQSRFIEHNPPDGAEYLVASLLGMTGLALLHQAQPRTKDYEPKTKK